jgi:pyridoxal phosphate enzyme (YggS family)
VVLFTHIGENLSVVRRRISRAAHKAGRGPDEITLVAISKTYSHEMVKAAVEYGVSDIGESRVQEAESKINALGKIARWHMVGHLQTNKVKKAVTLFDIIQSVDSLRLAAEISRRGEQIERTMTCLIEINSSGENSKTGINPQNALSLIRQVRKMRNITLAGLMTIGPYTTEEKPIRNSFRITRELFLKGKEMAGDSFSILSMGMSDDFEIAIEEGSNMIRIGTAIFGRRRTTKEAK